jgi:hypothetical protein
MQIKSNGRGQGGYEWSIETDRLQRAVSKGSRNWSNDTDQEQGGREQGGFGLEY